MSNERKILLLQIAQSPEFERFVEEQCARIMVDLRNHVRNMQTVEAFGDEKLIQYIGALPSTLRTFASK